MSLCWEILFCVSIDLMHRCGNISSVVQNPTCRFPGGLLLRDVHGGIYSSRKTVCASTLLHKFRSSVLHLGYVPWCLHLQCVHIRVRCRADAAKLFMYVLFLNNLSVVTS